MMVNDKSKSGPVIAQLLDVRSRLSKPLRSFVIFLAVIFSTELLIMFLLSKLTSLPLFLLGIVNASLLTVIAIPSLYFLLFRPLRLNIAELEKTEEKLLVEFDVLENSSVPILITDDKANIEYVNPAFSTTTGYAKEEVIGKNPRIMKSGYHDAEFYKNMWASLKETGQWEGEIRDRRKNGEIYPKWLSISAVKDKEGRTIKYVSVFSDISSMKQTEEHLEYLAHYDSLTNLPNRVLFRDRLKQEMHRAVRNRYIMALMYLDLDRFKDINDTLGHFAGDQLLKKFSERVLNCLRKEDTVARLGGDEFAIILPEIGSGSGAALVAQKIISIMSGSFMLERHEVFMTVSIGITLFPLDGDDIDTMLRNADMAMYLAKEQGNNKFQFYDRSMNDKTLERLSLETNLRHALAFEEFVLHYQPQVDLITGRIIGMEALIRRKETDWLVPPSRFIPLAEETGLIVPICEWTLTKACRQSKLWQEEGLQPLRLAVNVTAGQFYQKKLIKTVEDVLKETGLNPQFLELELTERIILRDARAAIEMMHQLKDIGVYLSIDDFGTGYSSLSYLKQFPIDKLKIDISFVRDVMKDPNSASIAKAIIALAHNLNLKAIAEGVETENQLLFMLENQCDEIQGFYFSVPLPEESFKEMVLSGKHLQVSKDAR